MVKVQESYTHGKVPVDSKWSFVGLCACFMGIFLEEGGVLKCFGVYFVNLQEKYDSSAAATAWVISITMCITMCSGIIGTTLFNWIGPRHTIFLSACLACVGCVFSSMAPNLQTLYFTFSVILGVSCGVIFAVSVTAAGVYFDKYRGLAVGITLAGSGLGSFTLAPLVRYFTNEYGVSGNILLLGGLMLQLAVFAQFHPSREINEMRHRVQQKRLLRKAREVDKTQTANEAFVPERKSGSNCSEPVEHNHNNTVADTQTTENIVPIENRSVRTLNARCADDSSATGVGKMQQNKQNELPTNLKTDDSALQNKQQNVAKCDALTTCTHPPIVPPMCPDDVQLKGQVSSNDNADNLYKHDNDDDVCERENEETCADIPCKVNSEQENNRTDQHEKEIGNNIVNDEDSVNVLSLLKNPLLLLYACTAPLLLVPYITIFVMLPPHAKQLGFSESSAALLVSIIGITEVVARIVNGFLIDRHIISNHILYKLSGLITAVGFVLIPLLGSYAVLAVITAAMAVSASLFSILPAIILREGLGEKQFPIGYGIVMLAISPLSLSFPVIAGKLRDVSGSWDISFYLMGSIVMAATIISLLHPWAEHQLSKRVQGDKQMTEQEISTTSRCERTAL